MNQKDKLTEATILALQNHKIVEANKFDNKIQEFIDQCEKSGKFTDGQMLEIRGGFKDGLSMEQVKFYADPKFAWYGMREIREGFENGLSMEQIKLYTDSKYDGTQMREIREGFENGLTMEQVKFYADPKFNNNQMMEIKYGFENGLSMEQVKFYADPKYSASQMEEIRKGFEASLTMEQIEFYADPKFAWYEMRKIREGFESGLTTDQIKNNKSKQNKKATRKLQSYAREEAEFDHESAGDYFYDIALNIGEEQFIETFMEDDENMNGMMSKYNISKKDMKLFWELLYNELGYFENEEQYDEDEDEEEY